METIQLDSLVICILKGPRADWLEIEDVIVFCRRGAYEARSEDRLADIGICTKDLMHTEMFE
jgi:hypothetical protein